MWPPLSHVSLLRRKTGNDSALHLTVIGDITTSVTWLTVLITVAMATMTSTTPSQDDGCPVQLVFSQASAADAADQTSYENRTQPGTCSCNIALREIYCHGGLDEVPRFNGPLSGIAEKRRPGSTSGSESGMPSSSFQTHWHTVDLSHQSINRLRPSAFGRLRVSRVLLNFNPIADHIDPRALAGLEAVLVELQLGACRIRTLPAGLLIGMDRLERLHLWANRISSFPLKFFRAARRLKELLLWGNNIKVLDGDALAGLWNLRRLDLDRNEIVELEKDTFRHLLELESLELAGNRIQALHNETFAHMTNLRSLSLSSNDVGFVDIRAFEGLSRLLSLALNDNRISYLRNDLFYGLKNLVQLLLQNNALESVWPRTFAGLEKLERLQLAGNQLSGLPDGALCHSPSLRYLDLEGNKFETLQHRALPPSALPQQSTQSRSSAGDHVTTANGSSSPQSRSAAGGKPSSIVHHQNRHRQGQNAAAAVPSSSTQSQPLQTFVAGSPSKLTVLSLVGNPIICDCRLTWLTQLEQHNARQTSEQGIAVSSDSMTSSRPTVWGTCYNAFSPVSVTSGRHVVMSQSSSSAISDGNSLSAGRHRGDLSDEHHQHGMLPRRTAEQAASGSQSIAARLAQLNSVCARDWSFHSAPCHLE